MNRFVFVVLAGCAVLPAQESLPPAAAVLDRFVEVTGGKAAYEKHHSQVTKGIFALPAQGITGDMTMTSAEPTKMRMRVDIGAIGTLESGTDGAVVWELSPLQGPRVVEGEERADELREARFNSPLYWREQYSKEETTGTEKVGDDDCVKVLATPKDGGHPETLYFSRKSGLLVKQTGTRATSMGDIPYENSFADYRNVDGTLEPFKTTEKAAGQDIELTVSEMKFNAEAPDSAFTPPAEIQALLKKQQPAAAAASASARAEAPESTAHSGGFTIYMGGNPVANETYSLTHNNGHYELSGSAKADFGAMKIEIEQYRVLTDDSFHPSEASVKAKMGAVDMSVSTNFSGGMAHSEIDKGQGPEKKDDPASPGDVVISPNLPVFPFTLLAKRVSTSTQKPQHFEAYVLGQGEAPLTVEYKGREKVAFARRSEELNHFSATFTPPQGQAIAADVWTEPDGRIIRMSVPGHGVDVYQEGYEPAGRNGTSPGAPAQSGTANPK